MERLSINKLILLWVFLAVGLSFGGPNQNAAIVFDYTLNAGNQGISSIDAPGVDAEVKFEVRVIGCSTLDSYSFELRYQTADLLYGEFSTKNTPKEDNILNQKGAYLFDSPIVTDDHSGAIGVVTISVVNTTSNPANCPSGDGLLGKVTFYAKVAAPRSIQFGQVVWKDPTGVTDYCKEENEGEFFMGGGSLPVTLSSFAAHSVKGGVKLEWSTESETNCWGFYMLRSNSAGEDYEQVTGELIRGAGNSTSRREYQWLDSHVEEGNTYFYKLQQLDINGNSQYYGPIQITIKAGDMAVPTTFRLYPNFPNPFNPGTTISYDLATEEWVKLEVYDVAGRLVRTLVNHQKPAGSFTTVWDGRNELGEMVSNGAYFCRLQAGSFQDVKKMMFLK
jgi:hypothetical protein